jgi:hypothetical protein
MVSRSPPSSKGGRRRRKPPSEEVGEGEGADEEPFLDDTKYTIELLRSAFGKLQDVGATYDIKAHHDVYKDPSMKRLTFRIH